MNRQSFIFLFFCILAFNSLTALSWGNNYHHPMSLQVGVTDTHANLLQGGTHKVRVKFWKGEVMVSLNVTSEVAAAAGCQDCYEFDAPFSDGYFTLKFGGSENPLPIDWVVQEGISITLEIQKAEGSTEYHDAIRIEPKATFIAKYADMAAGLSSDPTFSGTLSGPNAYFTNGVSVNGTVTANIVTANTFYGDGSRLTGVTATSIADNAVTSVKIQDGTIVSADIQDGAIPYVKLSLIQSDITGLDIPSNSDMLSSLSAKANQASPVFTGSMTGVDSNFSGTVTANIVTANIFYGDGSQLRGIGLGSISNGSITSAKLAANTIVGSDVSENTTITINMLSATTVTADMVNANGYTYQGTTVFLGNTLNSNLLGSNVITTGNLGIDVLSKVITVNSLPTGTDAIILWDGSKWDTVPTSSLGISGGIGTTYTASADNTLVLDGTVFSVSENLVTKWDAAATYLTTATKNALNAAVVTANLFASSGDETNTILLWSTVLGKWEAKPTSDLKVDTTALTQLESDTVVSLNLKANLDSPTFTGTVTVNHLVATTATINGVVFSPGEVSFNALKATEVTVNNLVANTLVSTNALTATTATINGVVFSPDEVSFNALKATDVTVNNLVAQTLVSTNELTATTVTINNTAMVGFGSETALPTRHPFFSRPLTKEYIDPKWGTTKWDSTYPGPMPSMYVKDGLTIYSKENSSSGVSQNPTIYFQYDPMDEEQFNATANAAFIRLEHDTITETSTKGTLRYQTNSGHRFTVAASGMTSRFIGPEANGDPIPAIDRSLVDNTGRSSTFEFEYYADTKASAPESLFNIGQYGTEKGTDYVHFTTNKDIIGKLANHQAEVLGIAQAGVKLESAGADYAEYLPRQTKGEPMEAGDIIGVYAGKITKTTDDAHRVMVISTMPLVVGNWKGKEDPSLYEAVAFVGQVPVKVKGRVKAGDYIVPSGDNDGVGVAIPESELKPEHYSQIVGQSWETNAEIGVKQINMAVVPLMQPQNRDIDALKAENKELRQLINTLQRSVDQLNK